MRPFGSSPAGSKKYPLVACTQWYTHLLLGRRNLETFKKMAIADLAGGSVIVHDRYQNSDSDPFSHLLHQLCTAHYSESTIMPTPGAPALGRVS